MKMESAIAESLQYVGKSPSEIGLSLEASRTIADVTYLERECLFDGVPIILTVTVEDSKVVQIGWSAKRVKKRDVLSRTYHSLVRHASDKGYRLVSSSVSIGGVIVMGDEVTHTSADVSFWISMIDAKRHVRIDMSYVLSEGGTEGDFALTVFSEIIVPVEPTGPY